MAINKTNERLDVNVNRLEWFLDMDPIDPATDIRIKRGWNGQETIPNQLVAQLCGKRDNQRDELGAFIVKACNSHADLLEACKFILSMLDPDGDHPKHQHKIYSDTLSPEDDDRTVTLYLRDIIKKAEGAL